MAVTKDKDFKASSDWFSFHLSHVEDYQLSKLESLWPECEKCRVVYESLNYTSTEGEFGLMTKEVLENIQKVRTWRSCLESVFVEMELPFTICSRNVSLS